MSKSKKTSQDLKKSQEQNISRSDLTQAQKSMGLVSLEPRILLDAAAIVTGAEVLSEALTQDQTDNALAALMENIETSEQTERFDIVTADVTLSEADLKALSPVTDGLNTIKLSETGEPNSNDLYADDKNDSDPDALNTIKLGGPFQAVDDGNFEIHSGETINVDLRANDSGNGQLVGIIDPAQPDVVIE